MKFRSTAVRCIYRLPFYAAKSAYSFILIILLHYVNLGNTYAMATRVDKIYKKNV